MTALSSTERTKLRRSKDKGREDRDDLYAVLRAAFVCHLGVTIDGTPMVVPTVYGFDDDYLYLHGSVASRSLTQPAATVCVTVTVVDGLVLARSLFEHSINYRSAMIYGVPQVLADPWDKLDALRIVTEHVTPGQWNYARRPSTKELAATTMLAIPLTEASVKTRGGPPDDADSPDAALGLWAGELPLRSAWQKPVPDPALPAGTEVPAHIAQRASPSP
ncbi:pyridoxamine 5'-phosphate oxidase family protein [Winogradskya humida]|nr:pyridoxamine 5'-phosphate oxidase family protein [Actinoplanes humidus]